MEEEEGKETGRRGRMEEEEGRRRMEECPCGGREREREKRFERRRLRPTTTCHRAAEPSRKSFSDGLDCLCARQSVQMSVIGVARDVITRATDSVCQSPCQCVRAVTLCVSVDMCVHVRFEPREIEYELQSCVVCVCAVPGRARRTRGGEGCVAACGRCCTGARAVLLH